MQLGCTNQEPSNGVLIPRVLARVRRQGAGEAGHQRDQRGADWVTGRHQIRVRREGC